jgi:hypothetical protein
MDFTAKVGAVATDDQVTTDYEWFCMFERCFLPQAFSMLINMLSRGNILVCRAAIILEDECPGLQAYITEAYLSVATLAAGAFFSSLSNNYVLIFWDRSIRGR